MSFLHEPYKQNDQRFEKIGDCSTHFKTQRLDQFGE